MNSFIQMREFIFLYATPSCELVLQLPIKRFK